MSEDQKAICALTGRVAELEVELRAARERIEVLRSHSENTNYCQIISILEMVEQLHEFKMRARKAEAAAVGMRFPA